MKNRALLSLFPLFLLMMGLVAAPARAQGKNPGPPNLWRLKKGDNLVYQVRWNRDTFQFETDVAKVNLKVNLSFDLHLNVLNDLGNVRFSLKNISARGAIDDSKFSYTSGESSENSEIEKTFKWLEGLSPKINGYMQGSYQFKHNKKKPVGNRHLFRLLHHDLNLMLFHLFAVPKKTPIQPKQGQQFDYLRRFAVRINQVNDGLMDLTGKVGVNVVGVAMENGTGRIIRLKNGRILASPGSQAEKKVSNVNPFPDNSHRRTRESGSQRDMNRNNSDDDKNEVQVGSLQGESRYKPEGILKNLRIASYFEYDSEEMRKKREDQGGDQSSGSGSGGAGAGGTSEPDETLPNFKVKSRFKLDISLKNS